MIQVDLLVASSRGTGRVNIAISVAQNIRFRTTTHFMEILVSHECEPELRRAANNTRWSTLEKSLEALLAIYNFSSMRALL